MVDNADKIAISFDYDFYLQIGLGKNKWLKYADGRTKFLDMLLTDNILLETKSHHLLGCAVPQEFGWYRGYKFIESIDTSNPVMAALEEMWYTEAGLTEKPKANMNDYFYMLGDQINWDYLTNNLYKFRDINGF